MTPPILVSGQGQLSAIPLENVEAAYGSVSMLLRLEMLHLSATLTGVNSTSNNHFMQTFLITKSYKTAKNIIE
jgi:hypothetical protein